MTPSDRQYASKSESERAPRPRYLVPLDLVRGGLIGTAELVPGVSGGTVALVTGVYDQLIDSADHVVQAGRKLLFGPDRWRSALAELRRTDWWLIVPVLIGMATAVLTLAGVMKGFVTDEPELSRGLFFGLVAASVIVPLRMLPARKEGRAPFVEWLMFGGAIVAAFVLTSFAGGQSVEDPALPLVFLAAAIAICALVIPGISGSFFLLAVGLYAPTLTAVDERNLPYIGTFLLGAIAGLAAFVKVLHHLLHNHRRSTLIVMAGLMIGSLRALWPWQSTEAEGAGTLLAPTDPVWGPIGLAVLGAVVVITLILVEERLKAGPSQHRDVEPDSTFS
ncbi:DUF368 domain-containing protein [Gulosibacter macacae]|uniref:DUF368 domain-containing protein n=1 Tax=Gulosibacter macacae TaxID=2488791 RepID=A0A3P3VXX4_9MICO|nr:DUF368 domain-containing protein [Gulosibacter macacae]RRJ86456.1 DUF368 domain-containing protein [Gulosibacter macacae]